ncbi:hypothetical protein ACRAWD_00020 [Caulobacter segnis]
MNSWRRRAKASRAWAMCSGRKTRAAWGSPIAKNLGEPTRALMESLGLGQGGAAFFVAGGQPAVFSSSPAWPARVGGAEAGRREPVQVLLDRRLPDVRMERGGEEGRLLAQPVLDAARRPGGPGDPRTR